MTPLIITRPLTALPVTMLRTLHTGSNDAQGFAVTSDSSNNVYVAGNAQGGFGQEDIYIAKYNSSGVIQWQRRLGSSNADEARAASVAVSSGDVYVAGFTFTTSWDLVIAKYNSSGVIQWQRTLSTGNTDQARGAIAASGGNIYVGGYTQGAGAGSHDLLLAKYNSSGTIQWQRTLGGTGLEQGGAVALDGSENVYISGHTSSTGAGANDALIAKYDSTGSIQWQRVLGGAGTDFTSQQSGTAVDGSGNVYIVGLSTTGGAGGNDVLLAKYDTNGVFQWSRYLGGSGAERGYGCAVDSSNNVYIVGSTDSAGAGSEDALIAKYDSSGNIQWQRALGGTASTNLVGGGITVDSAGTVYMAGHTKSSGVTSGWAILLARLPADGSGTGTYGSLTYQSVSLTDQVASLTDSAAGLTDQSSSLTDAAGTLSEGAATLTDTEHT